VAEYFCDAEILDESEIYFISMDTVKFEYGNLRSDEQSFSDSYSVKLNADNPYGMTIVLPEVNYGETYEFSVWRKSAKNHGEIIVSDINGEYYNSENEIVENHETGWAKMQKTIFIDSKLNGKLIKVYLYNPDTEPVYFDNFLIRKLKSF
jgi:hypothetical protein